MKGSSGVFLLLFFATTYGYSRFKRELPNGSGVNHPCPGKGHWDAVGHMNGGYTPQKNVFGRDFRDGGKRWTTEICMKDSDGDGLTNGEELGDPMCKWRKGDPSPGQVRGHPGFCEPDRRQCRSGSTHSECPNPRARGRGRSRTPPRRLPTGANDHPQTFLQKNIGRGGMGQGGPRFGMGRDQGISFPPSAGTGFRRPPSGMGTGSGFGSRLGGDTRGPSFTFADQGYPDFRAPASPGFTSFSGDAARGSFGSPGLSRDFGVSGGSRPGLTSRGGDFSGSPGFDRFSSSLDQRAIQGMGSPSSGPSFASSLSQFDIDRSVRARMDRERSRIGDGGMGFSGSGSSGVGPGGMGPVDSRGMGAFGSSSFSMGPSSGGGMGQGVGMGPGSGGFGTDTMGSASSRFSSGMGYPYPPFMTEGSPMSGPSFTSGMSMPGPPGMPDGSSGMMSRGGAFSRF